MRTSVFGLALALAACGEAPKGTTNGPETAAPAATGNAAPAQSAAPAPPAADPAYAQDGRVFEAAVGETIEVLLEHPQKGSGTNWKTNEQGAPVLKATKVDFRPGSGGMAVMAWIYEAASPGETSIRYFRTEGPNGPEIEARTIKFRVR